MILNKRHIYNSKVILYTNTMRVKVITLNADINKSHVNKLHLDITLSFKTYMTLPATVYDGISCGSGLE